MTNKEALDIVWLLAIDKAEHVRDYVALDTVAAILDQTYGTKEYSDWRKEIDK